MFVIELVVPACVEMCSRREGRLKSRRTADPGVDSFFSLANTELIAIEISECDLRCPRLIFDVYAEFSRYRVYVVHGDSGWRSISWKKTKAERDEWR